MLSSGATRCFSTWDDRKAHKFDAFKREGAEAKDYSVKDEWKLKMKGMAEPFTPKPEFSRLAFDPNIRHNMEDLPNDLIYRTFDVVPPKLPLQSAYVSI